MDVLEEGNVLFGVHRRDILGGGETGGGDRDVLPVAESGGGVVVDIDIVTGDVVASDMEMIDDILFHGKNGESRRT